MTLKQVSLAATAVLVVAMISLLMRRALLARGSLLLSLQLLAAALMLWARATFGMRSFHAGANPTEGGLVTNGPYRFIRHPIYSAVLLFLWAGVAAHGSITNLIIAVIATAAIAVRIGTEEALVAETYPEYVEYQRHTKRLVPFIL